jgi:hypothetical protein
MQIKIKVAILVSLFFIRQDFSMAQTSSHKIDSMTLTISYDPQHNVIHALFTNESNSLVVLPWQEQLPYISFDEDSIRFSIYLANENGYIILRMLENIPDFTFEEKNIELKPKTTSCKLIDLENMITKNELNNPNNLFVFAKYTIIRHENSTIKEYNLTSNKIMLH